MKRSEMVKKLYEVADDWARGNSDQNLVDVILNEVERLGMKPPKSGTKKAYCNNYDGEYTYPVHKWEDE